MLRRKLMVGAFNSCLELLPTEFGAVEVRAVNFRGEPIEGAKAALFRGRERFDMEKVGYGRYRLEVESSGYFFASREITVAQQRTELRVVMSFGMACIDPFRPIRGVVEGMRKGEELWVKAVPVYGVGGEEVRVDGGGTFVIPGLAAGEYLVLVLRGKQVAGTAVVRTFEPDELVRVKV
jgi:hypothetical protein